MYQAKIYVAQQGDNNLQLDTKFVKKHPVVPDLLDWEVGGLWYFLSAHLHKQREGFSKQNRS